MTLTQKTQAIQRAVGANPDGIYGNQTADKIMAKLGISATAAPGLIRVAIDAGHGQDNASHGKYDSGAVGIRQEADVVLEWAKTLASALSARGIAYFETRPSKEFAAPLGQRVSRAKSAGCTHLISIHCNDADDASAHGTETLYFRHEDFAEKMQPVLVANLSTRDRGTKYRDNLAILKFDGPCALIELGFIKNRADMASVNAEALRKKTCEAIADVLKSVS